MNTIQIKVSEYYGHPEYYAVMPQVIFDTLETAALEGKEECVVDKDLFEKMIEDFKELHK